MKTKKPILRLVALAALSFFTGNEIVAQTNIGAACGCPAVGSRTAGSILTEATNAGVLGTLPSSAYGYEITGNLTLTCDKIWTIDQKIYVGPGATLTIQPGTVIKGGVAGSVAAATALIIERGGKIVAPGTESCPIVFTAAADNLDGTYPVTNKGMWGGVLICGKATNNLTLAANGPFIPGQAGKMAVANGLGVLEGFASSLPQDQFGANISGAAGYTSATSPSSATYSFDLALGTQTASTGAIGQSSIVFSSSSLAAYALVGTSISGTGIPVGTTVTGVSSATISFSQALTASASGTYTFSNTYPQAPSTAGQYFQVSSTPSFANGTYGPFNVSGGVINFAAPYIGTPGVTAFDDNDNSGIMTYVSIRHSGANLLVGSEINGLTLASVGRGTKIEHIEIVSCADDNIEIFGGTVNLKYCTTLFGNDDMFDYDLGWTGKAQFLFGMKANQFTTGTTPSGISSDNDNGFEMDSDDSQSYNFPRSIPVIYNATIIGNDKIALSSDNTSLAAINAKENTGGEIYNSLFANFRNGFNLKKSLGSASSYAKGGEAWHNWINTGVTTTSSATGTSGSTTLTLGAANASIASGMSVIGTGIATGTTVSSVSGTTVTLSAATTAAMSGNYTFTNASASVGNGTQILKVKCNTFLNNMSTGTPLAASIGAGSTSGTAFSTSELAQFTTTDKNIEVNSLTGFNPAFVINGTSNVVTTKNDVVPAVGTSVQLGSGCAQAPMDGFFEPANYRGAFAPGANNDNWLSDWTYSQVLNSTNGVVACPTDINNDGTTDVNDFLIFSGQFGQACN
jgi:hypothetical protein